MDEYLKLDLPYIPKSSKWHTRSCDKYTIPCGSWRPAEAKSQCKWNSTANIYLPRCETIFYYQTNNCYKLGDIYRKQRNQAQGQIFFLIVVFPTGTTNKKNLSNSWKVNLGMQKCYGHTFILSCQHCPLTFSPFVKWPIFKVAIQEKLHLHCTRILRAQYHLKWRSHLEVLSAIKKKTC